MYEKGKELKPCVWKYKNRNLTMAEEESVSVGNSEKVVGGGGEQKPKFKQ